MKSNRLEVLKPRVDEKQPLYPAFLWLKKKLKKTMLAILTVLFLCPFWLQLEIKGSHLEKSGHSAGTNSFQLWLELNSNSLPAPFELWPELNPEDSSLFSRIKEYIIKKVTPDRLERFEEEVKPAVNSEAFDLYLLYFWLKGQALEGLYLLCLQFEQKHDDPFLLVNTGAFLYILGQFDLAQEALKKAESQIPDNPTLLNNLGVLYYRLNRKEEALRLFEKAASLDKYQPEANLALYLLGPPSWSAEKRLSWLKNSLQGAYRESIATRLTDLPLPLSFQQDIYINFPPLPVDFISYRHKTSYYQEAFLKLEEKESELKKKLDAVLFSVNKTTGTLLVGQSLLRLNSIQAYSRILELEGQLDFLEREAERPLNLDLDQIISQANNKLESVSRDYLKEEKNCLQLPREERPECLQKAREKYCQRFLEQVDYFYRKIKDRLSPYFDQFSLSLKKFLPGFYFWVRYLPEELQLRKRTEVELRLWRAYQGLWEKSFQFLAKTGQPSMSDCLTEPPLKPEEAPEPEITLFDPFSEINLDFSQGSFFFSLQADRIMIPASFPEDRLTSAFPTPAFTIYLFPPETSGSRPIYLATDKSGEFSDLGELGPWAFAGLSSSTSWKILINLSLLEGEKK